MSSLRPAARLQGVGITLIRQIMDEAPADALNLGLGQVDTAVPDCLTEALRSCAAARRAPYVLNAGLLPLREAIGDVAGAPADRVIVTCGVQQALALAILSIVDPGDEVVVPDPGFPVYRTLTQIAGGVPVTWPMRAAARFRPQWSELEPMLSPKTRLVVLASPGNPTGAVATDVEWHEIVSGLASRGIPYLSDEIYASFMHPPMRHGSAWEIAPEQGFVTSGLSKSHAVAGWRLGWLITPSELTAPVVALHQQLVTSTSSVIQQAALAAFGTDGERARASLAAIMRSRRDTSRAWLEAVGFEVVAGDGAFYHFVRIPGVEDTLACARAAARDAGVIIMPGEAFGEGGRGYLRVSYGATDETLRDGIERLGRWLPGYMASTPPVLRE